MRKRISEAGCQISTLVLLSFASQKSVISTLPLVRFASS